MGYVGTQHCYIPVTVVLDERSLTPAARNRNANEMHKNTKSRDPRRQRRGRDHRAAAAAPSPNAGEPLPPSAGIGDIASPIAWGWAIRRPFSNRPTCGVWSDSHPSAAQLTQLTQLTGGVLGPIYRCAAAQDDAVIADDAQLRPGHDRPGYPRRLPKAHPEEIRR